LFDKGSVRSEVGISVKNSRDYYLTTGNILYYLCFIKAEVFIVKKKKEEIITFKVDDALLKMLQGIENRSEFIRSAIAAALERTCPLCRGTGILTPEQRKHWEDFSSNHTVEECAECHAVHLVCVADK
jgi:hypothetical protein